MSRYYSPKSAPSVTVYFTHHPTCKGSGESGYSLGSPPEPEEVCVEDIRAGNDSIMDWLEEHGFQISKLEDEILEFYRD